MNEATMDGLLAGMKTRLSDILDAVWAERALADAANQVYVPIVYPAVYGFGLRMGPVLEYPYISIWEEKDHYRETGPRTGSSGSYHGWSDATHTLVMVAAIQSDDEEILERQVSRYKRALWQFFTEYQLIPGSSAYSVTAVASGRESGAAGMGVLATPNVRGVMFDIEVDAIEEF